MILAFVDLEMTGCDPERDRICEVAIHRVVGDALVRRVVSLVDPGVAVGASEAVHGIGDEALRGAPRLAELADEIAGALEGAVVVGHAIDFDLAFLRAAVARGELRGPLPEVAIDTRRLAQRVHHAGSVSLAALAEALALPAPAHRAEPDVITTRALFGSIRDALRASTLEHLLLAQDVGGRAALRDDVEALLREAHASGRAVRVCYRVPGRRAVVDELEVWWLAPPRVEGWMRRKGIRRALRGDRILWAEGTDLVATTRPPAGAAPTIPRVAGEDESA